MQEARLYDVQMERVLLGSLLAPGNARRYEICRFYRLGPKCFNHFIQHHVIYSAITELMKEVGDADPVLLSRRLKERGTPVELSRLTDLTDALPFDINVEPYCKKIKELANRRRMYEIGAALQGRSIDLDVTIEDVLNLHRTDVEEATADCEEHAYSVRAGEWAPQAMEKLEELARTRKVVTGISTGLPELDLLTCGLQPSDMSIVSGRPGTGKTSFVLQVADLASAAGHPTLIFSVEMARQPIWNRVLAQKSKINFIKFRNGWFQNGELEKVRAANDALAEQPLVINDKGGITVEEICAVATRDWRERRTELVVVDYMQLVGSGQEQGNRNLEVGYISRTLKTLARQLNLHVMAVSSLSREPEKRSNPEPRLSDHGESGKIEYDADLALSMYVDPKDELLTNIKILKQRNGPTDTVKAIYEKSYMKFYPLYQGDPVGMK